jgi:hypothetical protein
MDEPEPEIRCLVCRRVLSSAMPGTGLSSDGLVFIGHGNYGSTLYDAGTQFSTPFLEIVVCDPCVASAAADGLVLEGTPVRTVQRPTYTPWSPHD